MNKPVRSANGDTTWLDDQGRPHRLDGPAIISAAGTRYWFRHGVLHRRRGPAVEYVNGEKEYWLKGLPQSVLARSAPDPNYWIADLLCFLFEALLTFA